VLIRDKDSLGAAKLMSQSDIDVMTLHDVRIRLAAASEAQS
jgi:hypothetical protein